MSDMPSTPFPPAPPASAASPAAPTPPKSGMPWWGVLLIVLGAFAVIGGAFAVVSTVVLLTAQPGTVAPPPEQPGAEEPVEEPTVPAYVNDEFGYEVVFPGEPTENRIDQAVFGYDLEIVQTSWTGADRQIAVGTTIFPPELMVDGALDEQLQGSLDGAAQNVGGTVENSEFIDFGGERAISGTVSTTQADVHMLVVFHEGIQFSILSIGGTVAQHEEFLSTFRFTS